MPPAPVAPCSLRIFVVEDHVDSRRCLVLYFEVRGHTVDSAGTVATALHRLSRERCDFLLCDLSLPDGTGWDLRAQLPEEQAPLSVMMSGYCSPEDRLRSRAAGFHQLVAKPLDLSVLDALLELARLRREEAAFDSAYRATVA